MAEQKGTASLSERLVEEELLSSYRMFYRLAYSYVGSSEDAMDIVQEAAYRAITRADSLTEGKFARTWICRIVINLAKDHLRSRKKEISPDGIPEAGTEDRYRNYDLEDALKELNERERTIVILRFFEDMQIADIADVTGEKENTVKAVLYRSLKKLKINLTGGEEDAG